MKPHAHARVRAASPGDGLTLSARRVMASHATRDPFSAVSEPFEPPASRKPRRARQRGSVNVSSPKTGATRSPTAVRRPASLVACCARFRAVCAEFGLRGLNTCRRHKAQVHEPGPGVMVIEAARAI